MHKEDTKNNIKRKNYGKTFLNILKFVGSIILLAPIFFIQLPYRAFFWLMAGIFPKKRILIVDTSPTKQSQDSFNTKLYYNNKGYSVKTVNHKLLDEFLKSSKQKYDKLVISGDGYDSIIEHYPDEEYVASTIQKVLFAKAIKPTFNSKFDPNKTLEKISVDLSLHHAAFFPESTTLDPSYYDKHYMKTFMGKVASKLTLSKHEYPIIISGSHGIRTVSVFPYNQKSTRIIDEYDKSYYELKNITQEIKQGKIKQPDSKQIANRLYENMPKDFKANTTVDDLQKSLEKNTKDTLRKVEKQICNEFNNTLTTSEFLKVKIEIKDDKINLTRRPMQRLVLDPQSATPQSATPEQSRLEFSNEQNTTNLATSTTTQNTRNTEQSNGGSRGHV